MKYPAVIALFAVLTVSSLLTAPLTSALASSTPAVPEFTLAVRGNSYFVPPSYTLDQCTGKTVKVLEGYFVDGRVIEVIIENIVFTPCKDAEGNAVKLYYAIRYKGHSVEEWKGQESDYESQVFTHEVNLALENTVETISLEDNRWNYSQGGQVDVQVEALIGYYSSVNWNTDVFIATSQPTVFSGVKSGWSPTHTVTIDPITRTARASASPPVNEPSIPEFSVKLAEHPYDVPPVYSRDQYTGKEVMTEAGYHVENKSIEVAIKKQPFSPHTDENGNYVGLYYNVSYKGRFGDVWSFYPYDMLPASESDYTFVSFSLDGPQLGAISAGGQMDFRVQALLGEYVEVAHPFMDVYVYRFFGTTSEWSETQTMTVGTSLQAATSQERLLLISAISAFAVVITIVVVALVYLKRRKRVGSTGEKPSRRLQ